MKRFRSLSMLQWHFFYITVILTVVNTTAKYMLSHWNGTVTDATKVVFNWKDLKSLAQILLELFLL